MKLWLTRGMFGEKTELIAEKKDEKEIFAAAGEWKDREKNAVSPRFKIEDYDRIVGPTETGETAVDFGDYFCFLLIENSGTDGKENQ